MQPLARIAFEGLWSIADREGRLEYRPKEMKLYTVPYDDVEIDDLLEEMRKVGLIIPYIVNDQSVILIPTFKEHQPIHWNEKESQLPEYQEDSLVESIKTLSKGLQGLGKKEEVRVKVKEKVRVKERVKVRKNLPEPNPDHDKAIEYWCSKYLDRFKIKYDFRGGKDGDAVKRLLATFGLEVFCRIVDQIFVSDDPFYRTGGGLTLTVLKANANKLAQEIVRQDDVLDRFSEKGRKTVINIAKVLQARKRQDAIEH